MQRLKGKSAVITGGAQGIGKATAQKMLEEGASVAIWDINRKAAEKAIAEWTSKGYPCLFQQVNTTDLAAVTEAAKVTNQAFGRIDILVNNAGITRDASMKKMNLEQWQQVLDVNLTGVFICTKVIFPYMAKQGGGRILNAASVVGLYGNFGQTNYVASKAGIIGMTKTWAREFGRKGITVNAVAPGFIQTDMVASIPQEILDTMLERTFLDRLGSVEDVANAYTFLASDEAAFITGVTLSVDGGLVF